MNIVINNLSSYHTNYYSNNCVNFRGVKKFFSKEEQPDKDKFNTYNLQILFDEDYQRLDENNLQFVKEFVDTKRKLIDKERDKLYHLKKGFWNFLTHKFEKKTQEIQNNIKLLEKASDEYKQAYEQREKETIKVYEMLLELAKQKNFSNATIINLQNAANTALKKLEIMEQRRQNNDQTGFNKIGGYEEEKQILRTEFIDKLDSERSGDYVDSSLIPNAIMVYGPTGCGKTTFSLALAQETDCNYIIYKSRGILDEEKEQNFINTFYGYSQSDNNGNEVHVNGILENANEEFSKNERRRTIVLIDEFDRFFTDKTSPRFINALKTLFEDCGKYHVTIFVATNFPQKIPVELRSDQRIGITINIDPPDRKNAMQVIEHHLKNCEHNLDYDQIFPKLFEFEPNELYSNSHLESICKIAVDEFKHYNEPLTTDMFIKAIENYNASSDNPDELRITKEYLDKYADDKQKN